MINEDTGVHRNFATLESAIEALGTVRGVSVMKADTLDKQHRYRAEAKVGPQCRTTPFSTSPQRLFIIGLVSQ